MTRWHLDFVYDNGVFRLPFARSWQATSTGLFGPSGVGKSTLLEILLGLKNKKHLQGFAEMDGKRIFSSQNKLHLSPHQRPFAWLPQDISLFPHLDVERNILYGAPTSDSAQAKDIFRKAIRTLEIEPLLSRSAHQISGGEKQRVALARAVVSQRKILLLDEPLSSLDTDLKDKAMDYILRLKEEFLLSLIYVSHDRGELEKLCEMVIEL